jgi:hypothetical protein
MTLAHDDRLQDLERAQRGTGLPRIGPVIDPVEGDHSVRPDAEISCQPKMDDPTPGPARAAMCPPADAPATARQSFSVAAVIFDVQARPTRAQPAHPGSARATDACGDVR